MVKDSKIWESERAYLGNVVCEISKQLEQSLEIVTNYKKEALATQKEMWEDVKSGPTDIKDMDNAAKSWQYQLEIRNQARKYVAAYQIVEQLKRMIDNPYFGRIDFIEDGEKNPEVIYIGVQNLSKNNSRQIIVYDWRAPVSSMFYDYEIGMSSYECPVGKITGEMLLKRQFKIELQKIVYMFDSSLRINDEMLQEMLGKSTDSKMKTIVTSIQQEQNRVIRDDISKILIVQGAAGSGKTSIALHRAAYILYKHRENIKSENILIFSPNHVFEDYISNVLPELGEENIQRSTFLDYFTNKIDNKYRVETMNEQMEGLLSDYYDDIRIKSIQFKASKEFLEILESYCKHIENGNELKFQDIGYKGKTLIKAEEIRDLFINEYKQIPYVKRLDKLHQRLLYILEPMMTEKENEIYENELSQEIHLNEKEKRHMAIRRTSEEFSRLKGRITEMTSVDVDNIYRRMLENIVLTSENKELIKICKYTLRELDQNILNYEDIAPLVFFHTSLGSFTNNKVIKHVIIDEAQDYTAVQYKIFKNVFSQSKMTILGDINQSINGFMNIGSFDVIKDIFETQNIKALNNVMSLSLIKSYRSTKEITNFANGILKKPNNSENLNRTGNKPLLIKVSNEEVAVKIAEDIKSLKANGQKLVAVICKTAAECENLYKVINSITDITFISNHNEIYKGGNVIIPSYLAKGLEFDAVIIYSVDEEAFGKETDRKLLYTLCSRALHELHLVYSDNLCKMVEEVDENLYISKIIP
jgi:DNA helicase-2/ATP-dependent DNA helicase PcrA